MTNEKTNEMLDQSYSDLCELVGVTAQYSEDGMYELSEDLDLSAWRLMNALMALGCDNFTDDPEDVDLEKGIYHLSVTIEDLKTCYESAKTLGRYMAVSFDGEIAEILETILRAISELQAPESPKPEKVRKFHQLRP